MIDIQVKLTDNDNFKVFQTKQGHHCGRNYLYSWNSKYESCTIPGYFQF